VTTLTTQIIHKQQESYLI